MTDARPIVLCMPIAELAVAHVPSAQRWCSLCGTAIWVSYSELAIGRDFVCHACGLGMIEASDAEIQASPSQRRAGATDADAERLLEILRRRHRR